jgi:DNA-binding NarL/FixJ family response regulator
VSVRILVVDDFEPWRRIVFALLQDYPDWQIIAEAADGLEAVQKSEQLQPDLILLDIGLPQLNGIEAARQIYRVAPNSRILFVSENVCPVIAAEALRAGGWGYVIKSDAANDLLFAVKAVLQDKHFVSSRLATGNSSGPSHA